MRVKIFNMRSGHRWYKCFGEYVVGLKIAHLTKCIWNAVMKCDKKISVSKTVSKQNWQKNSATKKLKSLLHILGTILFLSNTFLHPILIISTA